MTYFESLIALLLAAILLLQVSRRLSLPYPAMLAAAGVLLALVPNSPVISIDPATALALFVAPALLNAAFDFPAGAVRRLWQPLVSLAVIAVLLTAAVVAWIGWAFAGLPMAAAVALGAIVAPPDAAAATAVLGSLSLPRRTIAVLKGESLLNDATALLLFGAAVAVQQHGGVDAGVGVKLALAAPGGALLGFCLAWGYRRVVGFVSGTLGGTLFEFVTTFCVWIAAERLALSPVLCVVAFGMTIAHTAVQTQRPRVRVHSYAVWETVVFLLNVFAFLLMGMQARIIVGGMDAPRLHQALMFVGLVIVTVIAVRMLWVMLYNRLSARLRRDADAPPPAQGLLVGWCGMRGLVTLATAFALPASFPQRDLIVFTAFAVVLATLVVQGVTLAPLIRLLRLDRDDAGDREIAVARSALAEAALAALQGQSGREAESLRYAYQIHRKAVSDPPDAAEFERHRHLGLKAVRAERMRLIAMRAQQQLGPETFELLQEELDWQELSLLSEDDNRIEEN